MAGISDWIWVPAVGLLGTYVLLLFPDGKLPSRRWRPLAWLSGAVILLLSLGVMLAPGPLDNLGGVRNPFGIEGADWLTVAAYALLPLLPLCMLASALSLVLRYRRSGGEERQQIKWIAFAASVVVVLYAIAMIASFVFPAESWTTAGSVWWLNLLTYAVLSSFTIVPMAVGMAVLKYRLYEIDIIINRALVYVSLTATLVALYLSGIVLLQRVFVAFTGQRSTLAVVASTLLIAALFNPLRRRIQSFIDRRFYRSKYDAGKTLEAFSAKLRDETDMEALSGDLVGVVRETMQPSHVSLWLRPETAQKGEQTD
jgi:MFS family permease